MHKNALSIIRLIHKWKQNQYKELVRNYLESV